MAEWQPIETAPRDGTSLLLWTRAGVMVGWWDEGSEDHAPDSPGHDPGWFAGSGDDAAMPGRSPEHGFHAYHYAALNQPTHWMPLPEPPA